MSQNKEIKWYTEFRGTHENTTYEKQFKSVSITSPEQFVPLFVTQISPNNEELVYSPNFSNNVRLIHLLVRKGHELHPPSIPHKDKEKLSEALSWLTEPYPSQYKIKIFNSSVTTTTQIRRIFSGIDSRVLDHIPSMTDMFGLGILLRNGSGKFHNHMSSHYFKCLGTIELSSEKIKISGLIIVKAKHIPYLRTCLYLNRPVSGIKDTDMKVIISTDFQYYLDRGGWQREIGRELINFADRNAINIENVSTETINEICGVRTFPKSMEIKPELILQESR